jgi:predicted unusual protein kinase regulating ubiquinone biosynthesis (AarF/ABC1/UbiB family)
MYRGFVRLRGVYIKLGQILSVMGSFLPPAYAAELEALQDEVPPRPYRAIARAFRRATGRTPEEAFARFAQDPIAAASLGQVHEATTHEGERVAVKVLYPDVGTIIAIDLRVLGWVLRVYRWFVPVHQIERVHAQLRDLLERETDTLNEARCIERMAANAADDPDVLLPRVFPALGGPGVLTMSYMDGVPPRADDLRAIGLDPVAVASKLIEVFYKQLFVDRFFHADPHPGNFFVQRGPAGQVRIVVLDLGSASVITDPLADGMFEVLTGLMTRDDDRVVRGVETMGFVAAHGDRALLERVTRRYFAKLLDLDMDALSGSAPEVATKLDPGLKRDELRRLMASVEYPLGWFYVERALVIMFGLCLRLAPRLNTLQVGFPYVVRFLAARTAAPS